MNIRQALGLPDLLSVKRVICVQPHPDDNEVGAGGTIYTLHQRGCEVVYVTVTDGRAGAPDSTVNPDHLVHDRQREKMRAGQILGVSRQIDLGFPDGGSYYADEVAKQLVEIYREIRPDMVMTVDPWAPYEAHPDHQKTGMAVARALLFSNNTTMYPIVSAAPVDVPQVAFYATSYPNTFVDVTDSWDKKLASIQAHKSQFDNPGWPVLSEYFRYQAREMYRQAKQDPATDGYAEAFKVLAARQLHFFPMAVFS